MNEEFNDLIKIEWADLDEIKPEIFKELKRKQKNNEKNKN